MNALTLFVLILNFVILFSILGKHQDKVERRLKRIEFYMDLVVDHLELDRFPEEVKQIALNADPRQRLKAVKLYQEKTGATFQEAVKAVEKVSGRSFRS
ncbi:hypothetical protein HJG54_25155 [Leptolyngbya sp. NK1-12]|uniref:Uncharacterized protein n=1 Tax=Leptolyngbya sp. NK1-12 TaxID=2547451 RepID=A0AA97AIQ4_9CYAN|nr:hypothetical protein [Leptolyngbya sp. NK1-12]WNZ25799.1 hypothetical protein HJG54_25155 [Leptolyngbya sp. NK1-12]